MTSEHTKSAMEIEEEEAVVVEKLVSGGVQLFRKCIRFCGYASPLIGDTVAFVNSYPMRQLGKMFELISRVFIRESTRITSAPYVTEFYSPRLHIMLNKLRSRVGLYMVAFGHVFSALSKACIVTGEVVQSATSNIARTVSDSFFSLETIPKSIQAGAGFLLRRRRPWLSPLHISSSSFGDIENRVGLMNNVSYDRNDLKQEMSYNSSALPTSLFSQQKKSPAHIRCSRMFFPKPLNDSQYHLSVRQSDRRSSSVPLYVHGTSMRIEQDDHLHFSAIPFMKHDYNSSSVNSFYQYLVCSMNKNLSFMVHLLRDYTSKLASAYDKLFGANSIQAVFAHPSTHTGVVFVSTLVLVAGTLWARNWNKRVQFIYVVCLIVLSVLCVDFSHRVHTDRAVALSEVKAVDRYLTELQNSSRELPSIHQTLGPMLETSLWMNAFIESLWSIGANGNGGLGAHISWSVKDAINEELKGLPRGMGHLYLKRFSLGSVPPKVRGVRVFSKHPGHCMAAVTPVQKEMNESNSVHHMWDALVVAALGMLHKNSTMTNKTQTLVPCERIVIDVDTSFISQDMDLIFSLRRETWDEKSYYGEGFSFSRMVGDMQAAAGKRETTDATTATVSDVMISGIVRIDSEIVDTYPFLGNASVSFLRPPAFDLQVNALGGVDVSSMPGVQRMISASMEWYMQQYTYPNYHVIDLYAYFCPECLGPRPPTAVEVMLEISTSIKSSAKKLYTSLHKGIRSKAEYAHGLYSTLAYRLRDILRSNRPTELEV
eukprot:CAMPEP_0185022760 /NCGR_PEP_ID=MMETSP1103-20130426/5458_1 /TAXON_ID=36769 /ORGANISM="Paraphysomonas bandaiensis, Strain Caron Lab Isolate" /LENGTH=766 /DNA_ID=CAMNT_0027554977 /DNA_START=297 /DNA_END=2600 /DNA_ORIENTATION=-